MGGVALRSAAHIHTGFSQDLGEIQGKSWSREQILVLRQQIWVTHEKIWAIPQAAIEKVGKGIRSWTNERKISNSWEAGTDLKRYITAGAQPNS